MAHSEIRSRAGIPSMKFMLLHRQLRWLDHVIRMPDSRLPHRVFYGQLKQDHKSVGGQKKRFTYHIESIIRKCNIPFSMLESSAFTTVTCRPTTAYRMSYFDAEYNRTTALTRNGRHQHAAAQRPLPGSAHQCPLCG